ncbi:hypothetical protein SLS64_008579 [Diaporthe eres]
MRMAYINATLCLMSKPALTDPRLAAGAKSRYDDFVAIHINQTQTIHNTANFLTWHRLFTWKYEQALISECGYEGALPYWDWAATADDPLHSEIFDGSDWSMSGNGVYAPHGCTAGRPGNCIPPGDGGGCVDKGPFRDMTVNLGPIQPLLTVEGIVAMPANDTLRWNPRCLRRDITNWTSTRWTSEKNLTDLLTLHDDISSFQYTMQGNYSAGDYGVHGGAHCGDLFNSPGDPIFFLHHSMIDRVFWIWQNLHPEERTEVVGATITRGNQPPSRNGSLTDELYMGVLTSSPPVTIGQAGSTLGITGAPFCYIYT